MATAGLGLVAVSGTSAANIGIEPGYRVDVPVRPYTDLRDRNLVRQRLDYSCGAAALATMFTYQFGDAVSEQAILKDLLGLLPEAEMEKRRIVGFTLLDLQRVAQARGYRAQGFRLEPEHLPALREPVIVFVRPRGYKHFAVFRGIKGDRVFLADPSRGNVRMPAYRFLDSWLGENGKGIIFVIQPEKKRAYESALAGLGEGVPQPELMNAREMLAVGSGIGWLPYRVQ